MVKGAQISKINMPLDEVADSANRQTMAEKYVTKSFDNRKEPTKYSPVTSVPKFNIVLEPK